MLLFIAWCAGSILWVSGNVATTAQDSGHFLIRLEVVLSWLDRRSGPLDARNVGTITLNEKHSRHCEIITQLIPKDQQQRSQ